MKEMASLSASSVSFPPATVTVCASGTAADSTVTVRLSMALRVSSAAAFWMSSMVPTLPCLSTEMSTMGIEWIR